MFSCSVLWYDNKDHFIKMGCKCSVHLPKLTSCMQKVLPKLQSELESSPTDMKGTVPFKDSYFELISSSSGVKKGCVLFQALFGIFFALLRKSAFGTRSEGNLFNFSRIKGKNKACTTLLETSCLLMTQQLPHALRKNSKR